MEIITITSVVASMVIIAFTAYSFGKEQGRLQFKNKVNNLTVRKMLKHKREQFKNL